VFEFKDNSSNIRSIDITETDDGADVEIVLADDPVVDDAQEFLSFSLHLSYDKSQILTLEKIKEGVLRHAQSIIAHEITLSVTLQGEAY